MADITKINVNGTSYNIKDSGALRSHQDISGKVNTTATAATNLDTVTTSGFYRVNDSYTNVPNSLSWGQLIVCHGGSDTITQIYGDYGTGHLYTRSGNPTNVGGSGKYTSWLTLIDSGNIGSQSVNYASSAGSVAWANVSGKPTSMPASDVYSWAKASSKPTYTAAEVGAAASNHTHPGLGSVTLKTWS